VEEASDKGEQGLVVKRFGKRERERSHGGEKKGSIHSCSWLECLDIFLRVVAGLLLGAFVVWMGGGR
jgi:hypothetical protein